MGQRSFNVVLVLCGLLVLVSPTPFPGAMLGFFLAITIAFFAAPAVFGMQAVAARAGLAVDTNTLAIVLVALYGLLVLGLFASAWRWRRRGDLPMARDRCARGMVFLSIGIAGYFSAGALADAWP
jgi:hypothetical protein